MTPAGMNHIRRRLPALKKRIGGDPSEPEGEALRPVGDESAGDLPDVPVHPPDMGSDNFDEELSLALLDDEGRFVMDIDDAPARIEEGTYGRCEQRHREISRERVEALPDARYCIRCAEELQGVIRA